MSSYAREYAAQHNIDCFITDSRLGDATLDGHINIYDATFIQLCCIGRTELSYCGKFTADVNGDGKINIRDVTLIQMYLLGRNTQYKIGEKISSVID